jgi:sec-independent protein translocase protein TatA
MTLSILLGFLGGQEILIIAILVLLLFGGKKIPELMRGLGKGIKEFKDAKDGAETTKEEEKK